MKKAQEPLQEKPELLELAKNLTLSLREPVVLINNDLDILSGSRAFKELFNVVPSQIIGENLLELLDAGNGQLELGLFTKLLTNAGTSIENFPVVFSASLLKKHRFTVSGNAIPVPGQKYSWYLISFEDLNISGSGEVNYRKVLGEVLSEAPAMICILRGPDHVIEIANDRSLQLVDYKDVIGKKFKEVMPEIESQGFLKILDHTFKTGETFVGKEMSLKLHKERGLENSILDLVYQPLFNSDGEVDGIFIHAIDVTEKVLNRMTLENSEKELRNLIDTVPVIIWITNANAEGYYLNKTWYEYTGQAYTDSKAKEWLPMIHPEDMEEAKAMFLKAHKEKIPIGMTYRLKSKTGEYRWVRDQGRPKFSPEGEFQGLIGSVIDIHEDKIKEQVIRKNEHQIRSIVEEATVATAVYLGEEMRIALANDAMLSVWGRDRSVVGKILREAIPEIKDQPFHGLLQHVYKTGEIYWGKEDRADLMRNGKLETGYFNYTYKPLRNEDGEIYGILNMAVDVSEMVESKNLLKESERHFRLMANLMPEKVMNLDPNGDVVYINQNWLDYTGLSAEAFRENEWKDLVYPEDKPEFLKKWNRSMEKGIRFETEIRIKNKDGAYLWHLSRAEAVKDSDANIKMWISTNTEIQRLKEEEKRKEDFLKMVSHELKTPVTSIKGYVQLLLTILEGTKNKELLNLPFKPSLERIDHQIVRLTRLISEMLDLSRIEEGKLELQMKRFSINDLVEDTVQDIILTNTQHNIEIVHDAQLRVRADKDRIGQVLINLITNAIKYSPESNHVEVIVTRTEKDEVAVKVRDRGIGIEKKFQKNIFKRFYRIGVESEETYSGFGIGLYLANEIMQRHNGRIEVKSEVGKGSEFSLVLIESATN
jgi:PAS domain S-box-containing protein